MSSALPSPVTEERAKSALVERQVREIIDDVLSVWAINLEKSLPASLNPAGSYCDHVFPGAVLAPFVVSE